MTAKRYLFYIAHNYSFEILRPLQRVIDDEIKKPLSKMMLFGELTAGGMVEVSLADEKLIVNFKVGKQQEVLTQFKPTVSDEKKSQ